MSTRKVIFRLLHYPPRVLYALGLGPIIGQFVLLLITTGRKSGKCRVTPLQYEEIGGVIYVAAARGHRADWFRNLVANPQIQVRVKSRQFKGIAEAISNPKQVADFLQIRLQRHPRMIGLMLQLAGLPAHPSWPQLEAYAAKLTLVALKEVSPPGARR